MIKLKINNKEVEVKKGSTILAAAKKAGVFVPTLCHDERLTPYGACRLCMVAERKKPARLIPSCFTPARDRMDIVTDNSEILKSIKKQLQLILINHPLDCPVCDKAGECALQNLTIRYGITEAPYKLELRAKPVDRMSSLIERDMNRCILCGRCVRICGELQGRHEIDFINRGIKTIIGTDGMRPLNCDFCGQCVSTCPVGALTDNVFKNTTRSWKLQRKKTVCSHCGMGCEIVLNTERGKIRRVIAPFADGGALQNLCARGRFGWKAYESENHPLKPSVRINGSDKQVEWPEAIAAAAKQLDSIRRQSGGEAIAAISGDSLTIEEAGSYSKFFGNTLGTNKMASISSSGYRNVLETLMHKKGLSCKIGSLEDIENSDVLLIIGGGAAELHPVLKTVISNFLKKEGRELVVISSWPDYCFSRATLPVYINPEHYDKLLLEFSEAMEGRKSNSSSDISSFGIPAATLARFISLIRGKQEITLLTAPDILCSSDIPGRLAIVLHERLKAVIPLGAACNSRGAVLRAGFAASSVPEATASESIPAPFYSGEDVFRGIEAGTVRALYILGEDPLENMADPERIKKLLNKLDLIICQSPYRTSVSSYAHINLPSAALPEKSGTIVDLWGREHILHPALDIPSGAMTDLNILTKLEDALKKCGPADEGEKYKAVGKMPASAAETTAKHTDLPDLDKTHFPFTMTAVASVYGDGIISRQSPELSQIKGGLKIIMHNDDLERLDLVENDAVAVMSPFGKASGHVETSFNLRRGNVLIMNITGNLAALSLFDGRNAAIPANIRKMEAR
ncbi:MAG: hypothetical protein CVU54_01385 [Deltaproteobacteria bacterium HGW-Deltaproteobacteria-12]|jgi:NADH dehydrogenase/NADH:ubiquinone oxidoreductase subunit G|nr:MAG: hypothetical protein CVU54_01385 [Deltaproteobacteria bacterium HGW-Deltaproteobacteria-12]